MRIVMFGHKTVPSRDGGVEIVVEELAKRMVKSGNEVTVFNRLRKNNPSLNEFEGIKLKDIYTIDKKSLDAIIYAYNSTKKVVKMGRKNLVDIVHVHAEGPCAFLRLFPKKEKRKYKLIVTIHGLDWQRNKWNGFASKFLRYCEKQAVKYADEIIVLTKNCANYFKENYNKDTIVIPNGISIPVLKEPNYIQDKYGLHKNEYILFLARIVPEKGLDYLIDAWNNIPENYKLKMKLVIAGGPSHSEDYYKSIVDKCDNDSSIVLTGFTYGDELEELYSNAYLYVLPSLLEGMSMSLLEAKSYGNICLVSNIPENLEIIDRDDYTFVKGNSNDLKDKIIQLIDKKIDTHKNQTELHSWDEITKQTLKNYEME